VCPLEHLQSGDLGEVKAVGTVLVAQTKLLLNGFDADQERGKLLIIPFHTFFHLYNLPDLFVLENKSTKYFQDISKNIKVPMKY
jgi:hypothetical protein